MPCQGAPRNNENKTRNQHASDIEKIRNYDNECESVVKNGQRITLSISENGVASTTRIIL
jgi:hypothetical protein